jgi:hypothetical protein
VRELDLPSAPSRALHRFGIAGRQSAVGQGLARDLEARQHCSGERLGWIEQLGFGQARLYLRRQSRIVRARQQQELRAAQRQQDAIQHGRAGIAVTRSRFHVGRQRLCDALLDAKPAQPASIDS